MERFNIKKYVVSHPFGDDLNSNVASVNNIAEDFLSISYKDIRNAKTIVLVCMGSSGAIIATLFYNAIYKKYKDKKILLCHVKKENEESYAERVTGLPLGEKALYIWVDDFIESGATLYNTISALRDFFDKKGITFEDGVFKFDYVVCSSIYPNKCTINNMESITNNLIYNYL